VHTLKHIFVNEHSLLVLVNTLPVQTVVQEMMADFAACCAN
jgi:hypothetical protein